MVEQILLLLLMMMLMLLLLLLWRVHLVVDQIRRRYGRQAGEALLQELPTALLQSSFGSGL